LLPDILILRHPPHALGPPAAAFLRPQPSRVTAVLKRRPRRLCRLFWM